ncbi:MAG: adenylosuccinate lyase [Planctomycetes bacterium]|nr:adenylosuccinate lyase [Planctomycetota bacterium]
MLYIFSNENKFRTWRKLWIALAEVQHELGLPVTKSQISQLKKCADNINFEVAEKFEKELRHDVMAHIKAFAQQCPDAGKIIHLGATSAYVGDNTDLIQMRDGLNLLLPKLAGLIAVLSEFARKYKSMPTLAYTHLQPAQLTTVGKRACLWIQDLLTDLRGLEYALSEIRFLGVKGATGTQASFLELFKGDSKKVQELDSIVAGKMGFKNSLIISGQTYPRKIDCAALNALASIAVSASKFGNDIRLLQAFREIEEPFESSQVGSSAMAYKRNPMRSERLCSLSRFLMSLQANTGATAGAQWFERTLDDSANRRLVIPQAFLCCDAILMLYSNIAKGLSVNEEIIRKRVMEELPFIATENILMAAAESGVDRQAAHERIRVHSMAAAANIKDGGANDLMKRLKGDKLFAKAKTRIGKALEPRNFTGCAEEQVDEFVKSEVKPALKEMADRIGKPQTCEVKV